VVLNNCLMVALLSTDKAVPCGAAARAILY